jgi:hypothetical protein
MGESALAKPRWIRDFRRFLPLKSQFVFSGNVRDRYPRPVEGGLPQLLPLVPYLAAEHGKLEAEGIEARIEDEKEPGSAIQRPLPARKGRRDQEALSVARRQRNLL